MDGLPDIPGLAITGELGSGGFGVVYRARQVRIDRDVAVKLDNRVLNAQAERDKFLREARAAARLSGHPHVVSVYDAGVTTDGRPYIVMELCSGGSLADLLAREGPLPVERVVDIGLRLADALGQAHAAGVLHRDIKPANVLIDGFGAVKLADFGLAAILDAQEATITLGALSPSYAAPEAFAWSAPTPAADVYSLAATLYTIATGRNPRDIPWPATSLDQLATALRGEIQPIKGAPPNVNAALIRALAAESSARTPSAGLFADELRGAAPVPVVKPRRWLWPAAAVVLAVLAAVTVFLLLTHKPVVTQDAAPPTEPASASSTTEPAVPPPPRLKPCDVGYCMAASACFQGTVVIGGKPASAGSARCEVPHYWEAFAGGWLPDDAMDLQQSDIVRLPEVTKVCTADVMRTRTHPGATTDGWSISVLPSRAGTNGRPYFYCIGSGKGGQHSGASFTTG
ncbi:serine/threonine-protein kinase [Actinocrispum wychmicini]|uniref:non-specific serine/threonine protein kinase n=1 Tax=Actinocrispum wychmicini TaxID=1213861 RepID=A0A4R2K6H1_9PSEU|nr:serine/threonine-protein kinase [Actinocrispum wychmicini]TCO65509.1 serine/threonine protein kinase [Actinocrispum wychmicini]